MVFHSTNVFSIEGRAPSPVDLGNVSRIHQFQISDEANLGLYFDVRRNLTHGTFFLAIVRTSSTSDLFFSDLRIMADAPS